MKMLRLVLLCASVVMVGQGAEAGLWDRLIGKPKTKEQIAEDAAVKLKAGLQKQIERKEKEFKQSIEDAYTDGLKMDNFGEVSREYYFSTNQYDPSQKTVLQKVAFVMGCLTIRDHGNILTGKKNRTSLKKNDLTTIITHLTHLNKDDSKTVVYLDPELKKTMNLADFIGVLAMFQKTLDAITAKSTNVKDYFENGNIDHYIVYDVRKIIAAYELQRVGRGKNGRNLVAQEKLKQTEAAADESIEFFSLPGSPTAQGGQDGAAFNIADAAAGNELQQQAAREERESGSPSSGVLPVAQPPQPAAEPAVADDAAVKALTTLRGKLEAVSKKIKGTDGLKEKLAALKSRAG